MNIHEYQAKSVLAQHGVPVPRGEVAWTPAEAPRAAEQIGGERWVVKAQIHAGGRGKGGGVKLVDDLDAVEAAAAEMIGMTLVTPQTGAAGKEVHRVYVEAASDIADEFYFGMLVDRATGRVAAIASAEGGMEIEEVAAATPEAIHQVTIDPATGMQPFHARRLAFALGLGGKQIGAAVKFMLAIYEAVTRRDCALVEINPLVLTGEGALVALDAKMSFDDNALYRHKDIAELRDETEEDPAELEAQAHELNYVKLDGNIGCMVNGAGLAMATMDIIKLEGGEPANFLDVGGGATKERVTEAFKLILGDANVEGVLVNIFGGIMRCDVIAEGIVAAAREARLHVPLVVRLEGTNVELGTSILEESGLPIIAAGDLADAAAKVVAATREGSADAAAAVAAAPQTS